MPFADTDGIRTHYEVQGEGPPLLLLAPIGDNVPVPQRWRDRAWAGFKPAEHLTGIRAASPASARCPAGAVHGHRARPAADKSP